MFFALLASRFFFLLLLLTEKPLISITSLSLSFSPYSYAIVTLQATGHFTGEPYSAPAHPDWPSLVPSGKRFSLAPENVKVKVNDKDGKIEEITVLPVRGGGPRGLFEALGGKMPSNS